MKRACYIDTYSVEHMHEMFDASSLLMFCQLYDSIDYYARKDSIENVTKMLGCLPPIVIKHFVPLINDNRKFPKFRRMIKQLQATFFNMYLTIIADANTDIIINYNTMISIYPLNWISRMTHKRILLICHGEMQDLEGKRPVSFIFKRSICFFTDKHVKVADNFWLAVLGDGIRNNIIPLVSPQIKNKLLSFDHPAIFCNHRKKSVKSLNNRLVLGYIGGYRISKGADVFVELARYFKHNQKVEFRFIGNVENNQLLLEDAGIVIPKGVGRYYLSREELYRNISELDYALYCLPPEGYRFTASGSVLDALDCEVPVIGLRNDFFSNMSDTCGPFGFLEDNVELVKERIIMLLNNSDHHNWDINAVKQNLSPYRIAEKFAKSKWFYDNN